MSIFALILALVTWLVPAATAASALPPLTPDDRHRLARGEVVVLDVLPPGGDARNSQGGTALSRVHASADAVWRVLVDYPRHSGLYPRVVRAEVLETDAQRALVRYVVGVGPFSFGFHVNNYADEARRRIDWRLARGRSNDLFRDSWGYWAIEPEADDVLLTYAMAARTVLPPFITRGAERDGLVETIKAVRERAEHGS
jgi:hypothetical protein